MRRVLAIDPGLITGMACFEFEKGQEPVLVWSRELEEDDVAYAIRWEFEHHPDIEIVCERFVINTQTGKNSQAGWSLELIGVTKQIVRDNGRKVDSISFQSPADAMNMFPNPALKKLGYWHKGGKDHANDAIRHALLRLAKTGWPPARLLH